MKNFKENARFLDLTYLSQSYPFSKKKKKKKKSYPFSSSYVQMWELDHKEGWALKNQCFLNYGAGEDSWEPLGLQGDQTSQS